MGALLGFRTSSSTHENGFVAAANCFVGLTGRRAAGAGEPRAGGGADSLQKPDSPLGFLDSGKATQQSRRSLRLALPPKARRGRFPNRDFGSRPLVVRGATPAILHAGWIERLQFRYPFS